MHLSDSYVYHFSEDGTIQQFVPRAVRDHPPQVWTINAEHAPNYLLPRDCPRICIACDETTTHADRERFFGLTTAQRIIIAESGWLERIRHTTLFCYVFAPDAFVEFDRHAGYWVSPHTVTPVSFQPIPDLLQALLDCGVELRFMPSLRLMQDAVAQSSLQFSMIRMRNQGNLI